MAAGTDTDVAFAEAFTGEAASRRDALEALGVLLAAGAEAPVLALAVPPGLGLFVLPLVAPDFPWPWLPLLSCPGPDPRPPAPPS